MHIHMSQKEVSLVMPQIKQFRVRNDSELCEVFIPDIYQHTIQRDEIKIWCSMRNFGTYLNALVITTFPNQIVSQTNRDDR